MSSTTSSDCESCDCSQCTYSFENNHNDYEQLTTNSRHVPIYATMAHPLIYYAEVHPLNRRQNYDQPKKDNPFKKAFKWYTQERGRMLSNKTEVLPERSGFANWLDDKYDEYLRENGKPMKPVMPNPPMTHEPRTPRNSIAEPEQCPGASQKYGRFKSPWKKRRTSVNDAGDVPEKGPCGSCEYILKPKDLTRATSEHTPTSGGKSTATVTSLNMPCNMKCSGRSHSLSDVGHERSVPRHGDTVTHITHASRYQEHDPARMPTMSHQEQIVQVPSTNQGPVKCTCPYCLCPSKKEPEVVKILTKKQVQPCCPCPPEKEQEVVKIQEEVREKAEVEPCCKCHQEKIPQVKKLPSKIKSKTKIPKPLPSQEKLPEVVKVPSIKLDSMTQDSIKQDSIKQDSTKLPYCPCPQEKEPKVEKLPSQTRNPTDLPAPLQEKLPEVVKVPSKAQDPKNRPIPQQEPAPEVAIIPSKAKDPQNQPIPEQEKAPQLAKVPSKGQELTDQPGPCCKCHLKKVPEVVQVPSQSRAVQESCQVPEDKLVPVNEGTQYDSAPKPPRSTQNVRPCCCNTCNPPFPPPPPIICMPVKVQSSKISSPDTCLMSPSAVCDTSKKQKKGTQKRSVSCQFDEGNKSKETQHQNEPCSCSKPCYSNCHSVNQGCEPNSIRRQSHSTVAISEETGEVNKVKEVAVVNKFSRSVTCASNDAAQTSDHSICFDKDGICSCQCPLFLKIIYADVKE